MCIHQQANVCIYLVLAIGIAFALPGYLIFSMKTIMKAYLTTNGRLIHIQKNKSFYRQESQHRELKIVFKNDLSNSDFSNNTFMDCEFIDCNLSMTSLMEPV
jgi:hypothetical protein